MSAYPTDLYVVSQSARQLVVVDPPYTVLGAVFAAIGLLSIVGGIVVLLQFRVGFSRPLHYFFWSVPFLFASPFLIVAAVTSRTSHITLSAETSTLTVQKTLLSVPVGSKEYPFAQVRVVKVGVGNVCRFLYVSLVDQPAENLTSCTDRTGYGE